MRNLYLTIFAAVLMLGMVACNKENPQIGNNANPTSQPVWQVSLNAVKGSGTKALEYDALNKKILTSFKVADLVYVYNKTKGALDASALHPESDGTAVTISGSLSGDYAVGDVLELRYGPYFALDPAVFDYEEQTGDFDTLRDFGVATVTVTAVDAVNNVLTLEDAHFTNPYSIFRFSFVDSETGDPVPINFLWVDVVTGKLVCTDKPDGTRTYYGPLDMQAGTFPREVFRNDSSDPVWLSLCYEKPAVDGSDWMHFSIIDEVHKVVYDGARPMDGKIVNGKLYMPTIEVFTLPKPEVTQTASGDPVEPTDIWPLIEPDRGYYNYINPGSDITIAGLGDQCRFVWNGKGGTTVRFKGTTTGDHQFFVVNEHSFIEHLQAGTLTIDLDGNTDIYCDDPDAALIKLDYISNDVAIQGNGTLTVMASNTVGAKGFVPCNFSGVVQAVAPNIHAADGYTLEISEPLDNGNGTSIWTFTVSGSGGSSAPEMKLPPMPFYNIYNGNILAAPTRSGMTEMSIGILHTWQVGDKIWVSNHTDNTESSATVTAVDNSGYATISLDKTDLPDGADLFFGYPYVHWHEGYGLQEGQDGTLSGINAKYAPFSGGSVLKRNGDSMYLRDPVQWEPDGCIWKLSFTDGTNDITGSITKLTIKCDEWDEYVITPTSSLSAFYVSMYPQADIDPVITATTASGTYSVSRSNVSMDTGYFYINLGLALTAQ
ncbi:MAG: hypothetical protein J5695_08020 [Bacteroidales bacterium]|nr:hypothetical protein [Bacteroidales bacterium]